MERFYNTIKNEFYYLFSFNSDEVLNACIYDFIFTRYNHSRPHSFNNGLAPLVKRWSYKYDWFFETVLQFCLTTTNIGATFQVTQFASIRFLFPMLPVFPLLYRRSAYHVPSVPDVTCGAGGTCGTFAPSGKWYARVVLIRLAIAFVTFCESNKDTFDSGAIISLCALRGDEAMLPQIIVLCPIFQVLKSFLNCTFLHWLNPKSLERLFSLRLIIHKSED